MTIDHLSYSSLNSYKSCPRSYYLSRVKQAWSTPAWYFIVGSTVHDMIQLKLNGGSCGIDCHEMHTYGEGCGLGSDPSPALIEDHFMGLVAKAMEREPDTTKWLAGGSKDNPVVEEKALKLALKCYEGAETFLDDMDVWHVEYDVSGHLPGCSMLIKAYVDLIGEHSKHGPLVVDWKTGKTKPDNLQLETYNLLTVGKQDDTPGEASCDYKGLYVMLNPDAAKARPVKFKETRESLGKKYGEIEAQINKKIARPDPGFMCRFCDQQLNCTTNSGKTKRAVYYDTPVKDGWIPF